MKVVIPESRAKWSSLYEYYLCVIGFAVGFASLWRFPYLVYANGGGLFLVPYLICFVLLSIPVFYLETAIGQIFQDSVSRCYAKLKKGFRGLGVATVSICFFQAMYYNIFLAYSLIFLFDSFKTPLPWKMERPKNGKTWDEKYFYDKVLEKTKSIDDLGGMNIRVLIACIVSYGAIFLCIIKGIKTTGKVAYITATAPYVLLFIFLVRGAFLQGASDGIAYLFQVDWSRIFTIDIWVKAAGQALFQVAAGQGALVLFASYKEKSNSIKHPAFFLTGVTAVTGILCALVVFVYIGHISYVLRVPIDHLPLTGPDLVFIAYPAVITLLPWPNMWAVLFFVLLFFLGIDTQFAFIENVSAHFEDEEVKIENRYLKPETIRLFAIIAIFVCGLLFCTRGGFYYIEVFDSYTVTFPIMTVVALECHLISKSYGWKKFAFQIRKATGEDVPRFVIYATSYLIVPMLFILALYSVYEEVLKIGQTRWWMLIAGLTIMGFPIQQILANYTMEMEEEEILAKRADIDKPLIEMNVFTVK